MYTEIDGYEINYEITGQGEKTVVILQGWATSVPVYRRMAALLEEKYRVVRFDFPGFGASEEPREPWNVKAYTDFFIKFMEALGIREATLVGHSYGGRVILKLAEYDRLPFTVERIVLVDAAGLVAEKTAAQKAKIRRYKLLKKIAYSKLVYDFFPDLVDDWQSRQGSDDYRNASPIMRQALVMAVNEDLSHCLPKIQQDVFLIWGEEDDAVPLALAEKMDRLLPQSGLVVIKGAGHFPFLEQPEAFDRVFLRYFGLGEEK